AVLSNRYITDRFLPDKAIDLVDEAAAKLRTEIDSMPAELDEIMRRTMQLEIEREALKKEKDPASRDRLAKLEKEVADLKASSDTLKAQWQAEKEAVQNLRALREKIDQLRAEIDQAEQRYRRGENIDPAQIGKMRYEQLPALEKKLKEAEESFTVKQGKTK